MVFIELDSRSIVNTAWHTILSGRCVVVDGSHRFGGVGGGGEEEEEHARATKSRSTSQRGGGGEEQEEEEEKSGGGVPFGAERIVPGRESAPRTRTAESSITSAFGTVTFRATGSCAQM